MGGRGLLAHARFLPSPRSRAAKYTAAAAAAPPSTHFPSVKKMPLATPTETNATTRKTREGPAAPALDGPAPQPAQAIRLALHRFSRSRTPTQASLSDFRSSYARPPHDGEAGGQLAPASICAEGAAAGASAAPPSPPPRARANTATSRNHPTRLPSP